MSATKRKSEARWDEKSERWVVKVQRSGDRRSFYSTVPGRRGKIEAERKADEWLDSEMTGRNIKVAELYDDFIAEMKQFELSTVQYESYGKNRIVPVIGRRWIADITEQDFQNILNRAYKDGLSKKSLGNIRGCLTSFAKYARKRGCTNLRPSDLTVHKNAPEGEKKALQPEEIRKLFESDITLRRGKETKDRYINLYRFAVCTGLRPGELVGLKWEDVDENNVLSVRRSIDAKNHLTPGKNKNAQRSFKLIPRAQKQLEEQRKLLISEELYSTEWIFPDEYGNALKQANFYKNWKRYADFNGITALSPYELSRHTNISVNKDMPIELLKMAVGHSVSMDTLGNYGHSLAGEMDAEQQIASALLEKILNNNSKEQ